MKPLGLSVWKLIALAPMVEAGSRLFVDVTRALASPPGRAGLMQMAGKSDPLTGAALASIAARADFPLPEAPPSPVTPSAVAPSAAAPPPLPTDPTVVTELIARCEVALATTARAIASTTGAALFGFIRSDAQEQARLLREPRNHQAIMAGIEATWWLNEKLEVWLGEKGAADALAQSAPGNVTSEMGLAILDVADAIRPHADVVAFLRRVDHDGFLEELPKLAGGRAAGDAIARWLDRYGVRCVGEIDITRPRFREHPLGLVPLLLGNVANFAPGEAARRFARGEAASAEKERELLARLRALPDGDAKADETKRMIDRVRTFIGYREYPKFAIIRRLFLYKEALLREIDALVEAGVLRERDDAFFLTFDELDEAVRTKRVDPDLVRRRAEQFHVDEGLRTPRVLTSDGEVVAGGYGRTDVPAGALVGLAVSGGTVEGRARVVLDLADARFEEGDILVTAFTDPSWTPAFVAIRGFVTEVGGLMSHGAVIAREYGLPAVVGVEDATRAVRDGQRIRVHGTEGFVELL
jgi:pyruvate,water dikinase